MPFQFCPQCGTKLQPDFKFCPSCGEKLPCPYHELVPVRTSLGFSPPEKDGTSLLKTSLALSPKHELTKEKSRHFYTLSYVGFCITQLVINQETCHFISGQDHFIFITGQTSTTSSQVVTRSPLRQARNSPRLAKVTAPGLPSSVKEEQIKGECRSASSACFWFSALLYGGYQK